MNRIALSVLSFVLLSTSLPAVPFIRGDANGDGDVSLSDAVTILNCLFQGQHCSRCEQASDANGDGLADISDAIAILSYKFLGGSAPPAPYPRCGTSLVRTRLTCLEFPACKLPVPEESEEEKNADLSRLHYLARAGGLRGIRFDDHIHDDEEPAPRGTLKIADTAPRIINWNSIEGRRLSTSLLKIDPQLFVDSLNPEVEYSDDLCVEPDFWSGAPSQKTIDGITLMNFQAAFATEYDAYKFLKGVKARMPILFPFKHPDVRLGQGWNYSWGDRHGACDFWRIDVPVGSDPTFRVYAPAPGVVKSISWRGGGNTMLIEHTAPTGEKYLTGYLHMRNGKDHDLALALETDETASANAAKYKLFAENYSDHISWGTNAHVLQVEEGDVVSRGQFLGWAGNTGVGGASAGLNNDGSPTSHTGNVHLHFSIGVAHPTLPDTYLWVDPYGVYGQAGGDGCYDFLKDTEFERLWTPFYPSFHGVPVEVFTRYFGYYPGMGWGLRTLSVHRDGSKLLCSGSFDSQVDPSWITHLYMTGAVLDQKWDEYYDNNFVIRELNEETDSGGNPRFTAIWRQRLAGEGVEARANQTIAAWDQKWQDRVVDDGWRIEDYCAYTVNGAERRATIYTSDEPRPFYFFHGMTSAELYNTITDFHENGYVPVNVSAASLPQGIRYSVCLRKLPGCWKVYWAKSFSQYQASATDAFQDGYRLMKVQGYADSSQYLAVFYRSAVNGTCP